MILVIDNYDSFTYNLVQYIGCINTDVKVVRNDRFELAQVEKWSPSHIVISPGPGRPEEAGRSVELVKKFGSSISILGVCLGHQSIVIAYGGKVIHASEIVHGKTANIQHNSSMLFGGIKGSFKGTRYHSLVADRDSLPKEFKVTAELDNGLIMGIEHKSHSVFGVQFHPESIATENGMKIIKNFLNTEC